MTFKLKMLSVGRKISKHSPAIYTTVGILGLGATAYLAYKSKDKVEEVVEEIEKVRDNDLEVDYAHVGTGMIKALYLPITVGALSVASIFMSHKISKNRIIALSGALAAQQAQNLYMENKYKETHGEKKFKEFMTPTEKDDQETIGKDGKVVIKKVDIKKDANDTIGTWYEDSSHYVSDDHTYNMAYIESVEATLQSRLFQRGTLLLNEVREELGLERTRAGMLLGWTVSDNFELNTTVNNVGTVDAGEIRDAIWVQWSTAKYIYDDLDLNGGRYSI